MLLNASASNVFLVRILQMAWDRTSLAVALRMAHVYQFVASLALDASFALDFRYNRAMLVNFDNFEAVLVVIFTS